MKSMLPLFALTLACVACADGPAVEPARTASPPRSVAEPAAAASRPDVTSDEIGTAAAPAPAPVASAPAAPAQTPPVATSTPRPPAAAAAPSARPEARRISAAELGPMIARGEAILVDVRGEGDWGYRRAAGAIHIPYPELFARSVELPHEKLIALYCT